MLVESVLMKQSEVNLVDFSYHRDLFCAACAACAAFIRDMSDPLAQVSH